MGRTLISAAVIVSAAAVGAVMGIAPALGGAGRGAAVSYSAPLSNCRVTDGDTMRCGKERIRLLAIDAPELPGHCRPGRSCVEGDPIASTRSLDDALVGTLTIERVGQDRYGRTLGMVAGGKGNLSCWQLKHRQAVYKSKWDDGLRVARACPSSIL